MGTLTRKLARLFAIGMFLAVVAMIALSVYAAEADAHPDNTYPVAYVLAKAVYNHVDNDTYTIIWHDLYENRAFRAANVMVHAADDECPQTLFEDFSCGAAYK